ncbi:hypothetical protein GWG67_04365 [Bradyrhizobium sp. CSS354]|nr:hypothetical protein [Bradyrhizobium sp. CSS354]
MPSPGVRSWCRSGRHRHALELRHRGRREDYFVFEWPLSTFASFRARTPEGEHPSGQALKLPHRHGRACPGHPRLTAWRKERGCPGQARA